MNKKKRCAIYTRKSVDDGLEQEFNSLDAQREAGEAYIASQRANGWICLPERYDDGGFSGGNTNRPALQKLLGDCQAGLVDIIVVYKIDRLSRSICDFADLSKKLDEWGTTFVSVTQEINTATSAGRMMLNILVTFSQYEREVIAERIRFKMGASRKRGIWVGGTVPYGYKSVEKKLQLNEEEIKVVKYVFKRYIEVQSPKIIALELNNQGYRTRNGRKWNTSHIYRMLNNYTYIGEVNYKNEICKGEHLGCIEQKVWDRVHEILRNNTKDGKRGVRLKMITPLRGILRCGHCECAMQPYYSSRHGRKYYYYVCSDERKRAETECPLKKVPAAEVENLVKEELKKLFSTDYFTAEISRQTKLSQRKILELINKEFWEELSPGEFNRLTTELVRCATLTTDSLDLIIRANGIKSIIEELNDEEN